MKRPYTTLIDLMADYRAGRISRGRFFRIALLLEADRELLARFERKWKARHKRARRMAA